MKINDYIDHTYLKAFGTKKEIDQLCEEARQHQFKSVCVNPTYVEYCKSLLAGSGVLVCTVIGFPLGANTTAVKVFETLNAIHNGADEIDMVINIGKAKEGDFEFVREEVEAVAKAAKGHTLKVIIETCYLTEEEIKMVSAAIGKTQARFIKTSTGFGTAGATPEHVRLMKENGAGKEVKAAGGVKTLADFEKMVAAGATRIGTSNGVKLLEGKEGSNY
ncbi:MAG: deoxyribose-phosphate aldolase [Candidatus Izemoplasmatales bacterium]|nr:deoxyribose-phosphate aldolase [Candidatus Izemoplasmatales bacterium]